MLYEPIEAPFPNSARSIDAGVCEHAFRLISLQSV